MTLKVSVGMLAFNIFKTGRHELFKSTLHSLRNGYPYSLDLLTNGSVDRTDMTVLEHGGIVDNTRSEAWYGMQRCIELALSHEPDIVVLSADDITYHPGWHERLIDFWQHAPDDIKLVSLFLEPTYDWNTVREARDIGSERVLIRESCPSASWSFRASDAHLVLPMPQQSPGEDHLVNARIKETGYLLGQLDLAEHTGERQSAWNNLSWQRARPLDRTKWGL